MRLQCVVVALVMQLTAVTGFTGTPSTAATSALFRRPSSAYHPKTLRSTLLSIATASSAGDESDLTTSDAAAKKRLERKQLVRQEGGRFAFDTKFGALNPFAIYYGLVAIILGIPWIIALTFCKFLYFVTRNKIDKQVSILKLQTNVDWRRGWLIAGIELNRTKGFSSLVVAQRRLPVFFSHVWGTTLMRLTGCYPKIVNQEILTDYFKK